MVDLQSAAEKQALVSSVHEAYMEIFPTDSIEEKLSVLEPNAYVAVTCLPNKGVEVTLDMSERIAARGFRVVPHVAAKMVRGKTHLRDIADFDHRFEDIGVAGHPEGHPSVSDEVLLQELIKKQDYSNYLVTQICFDADIIGHWIRRIRDAGVTLPVWLGLPSVSNRSTLMKTSLRIGVGNSLRYLKNYGKTAARLMMNKDYRPDDLLHELAPYLADSELDIRGHHIYCFNQVEKAEQWRREFLATFN